MKKFVLGMIVSATLLGTPLAFAEDAGATAADDNETLVKVGYGVVGAGVIAAIVILTRQPNNGLNGSSTTSTSSSTQ